MKRVQLSIACQLVCMLFALSACQAIPPDAAEIQTSTIGDGSDHLVTETAVNTGNLDDQRVIQQLGRGSGPMNFALMYDAEHPFLISSDGDRYRLDVDLIRTDFGEHLDFSMYDRQTIYVCVSFDGEVPSTILDSRHKYQPIPLEEGKLPKTILFPITSEMNAFDEQNEKMFQDFLQEKVDEINPAVYLFDPDGYNMLTMVTFSKPSQIRWGESYLSEPIQHIRDTTVKNRIQDEMEVTINATRISGTEDVQFGVKLSMPKDYLGDTAYLYLDTSSQFPFSLQTEEAATLVLPTKEGHIALDETFQVYANDVFQTEEEKSQLESFLNGKSSELALSFAVYGADLRISYWASVVLKR